MNLALESSESARRLQETGPNEIRRADRGSPLEVLGRQFTSLMVLILVAAAVVTAAMGDTADAAAIFAIVVLKKPPLRASGVMLKWERTSGKES